MDPLTLWDLYPPNTRAVIDFFGDYCNYSLTVSLSNIKCILFKDIDRGVWSWAEFNKALKYWFPSLQTLLINQNYSAHDYKSKEDFHNFMSDPWLQHIWIEDCQTGFENMYEVNSNRIRVFNSYINLTRADEEYETLIDVLCNREPLKLYCKYDYDIFYDTDSNRYIVSDGDNLDFLRIDPNILQGLHR